MNTLLQNWEMEFDSILSRSDKNHKAGSLLNLVPSDEKWDEFLDCVRTDWQFLQNDSKFPLCLVVLYGGVAFYEYRNREFWEHFADVLGSDIHINKNRLNEIFADIVEQKGLKLLENQRGTDFVGSAVFHIGIPLHVWTHFLGICKWALRNDDWNNISGNEWKSEIERRAVNLTRLKNFLLDNRHAASEFVQTMLDARKFLHENPSVLFEDLPQRDLIRVEYFDAVPETADFLFPENSKAYESLIESRPYLFWHEEREKIELHLPPVPRSKLEDSFWELGEIEQICSANSDSIEINGQAFQEKLNLFLNSSEQKDKKTLDLFPK